MAAKTRTKPRKTATQQRSRLTVDALLEATARILLKEGYDRASTNKIAAEAGVSIGSLYQYFPSKEALVAAVIERHIGEMMQLVREAMAGAAALPVRQATRALVKVMTDAHRVDPRLHRALVEQVPRVGQLDRIQDIDREAHALVHRYLEVHREELAVSDLGLAAFVCVTTVESLTHAAIVYRPEAVREEKAEAFVDEVSLLLNRYLLGAAAAEGRSAIQLP